MTNMIIGGEEIDEAFQPHEHGIGDDLARGDRRAATT